MDSNLCLLCAGGEELESHIPSRLQVARIWRVVSLRDCRVVSWFGIPLELVSPIISLIKVLMRGVECNIASGVRVDDHIQWTSLFRFLTALLWHERNQVVFNGKRFYVSNFKSKFV